MSISKWRTYFTKGLTTGVAALLVVPSRGAVNTRNQLRDVAFEAMTTETDAGKLQSYSSNRLDWMAQGQQLMALRDDLNNLGREMEQLQSQNSLPQGEQRLIRRVTREVKLMANDTENAITFGRSHRDDLFNPDYTKNVSRIYSSAEQLNRNAHAGLKMASGKEGA